MTDRELLEMAAKAAGIVYVAMDNWSHQNGCRFWRHGDCCDCGAAWDPKADDGDAFRLLCKCSMRIEESHGGAKREIVVEIDYQDRAFEISWPHHPAATRDAIVRAAAEIGKAMP